MAAFLPKLHRTIRNLTDRIEDTFSDLSPFRTNKTPARLQDLWRDWPAMFTDGQPRIEMEESGEDIKVCAELPGLNKDDFSVDIVGRRLTISGEKKAENEEKRSNFYYSERSFGSFSRTIELPDEVDATKAEATYKNGELRLRLAKTEQAKARKIYVNVE